MPVIFCGAFRHTLAAFANQRRPAMKILIKALAKSPDCQWQVQIDQQAVNFRTKAEAKAFVDTLKSRLQAPHKLPEPMAV
jgi:hypothetical protein